MRNSATSLRPTGTTGCGSRSACRWACWTRLRPPSRSQSTRRLRGRPMAVQQAIPKAQTGVPGGFSGSAVRADFPVFDNPTGAGKRLVYLDAAASSPKPRIVIDTMADTYAHHYANVHRGIYELSEDATGRFEGARRKLAGFINAPTERECVFVRNATEAINLIAYSWGRSNVGEGDRVITTQLEHHANIVPWQQLCAEVGATLEYVAITDDGRLDLDDMAAKLEPRDGRPPRLLAVAHVSNALGTINPVAELVKQAHAAGALVLVDAAQSAPHMPVDVQAFGCDFLALSGHKMCGPSGIGALWARRELLEAMPPFMGGGEMISNVTVDGFTPNEVPWKFEAGTMPIVEAVGFGAAVDYLGALGMDAIRAHERGLEIILDHYRAPRNRGELPVPPAHKAEGFNPLCGDEVVLYLDVDGDTVTDLKIAGQGCSISQASTSMMSAAVKGKSVAEARRLIRAFKALMSIHESKLEGEGDGEDLRADLDGIRLGDLEALQGVVKFPVRIKCATLAWNTLQQGLDDIGDGDAGDA